MPTVKMPDGAMVEMPDQLDPALGQRLRAFHDDEAAKAAAASRVGPVSENLLGPSELLGSGIANIPHAAAHAVVDLARRVTGGDTSAPDPAVVNAIHVPTGQAGTQLAGDLGKMLSPSGPDVNSQTQDIRNAALGPQNATVGDVLHQAGGVAQDVASIVPAAGAAKAGIEGLASGAADATGAAAAGFRSAANSPIARTVAGSSGKDALTLHNQEIGNTLGNAAGNVPHGTPLGYEALEAGRAAPNEVYGRVASQIPTGPLSPAAAEAVKKAGGVGDRITNGTPDAATNIDSLKAQMLDPNREFTGNQVVNEMRGLRQEGYVNIGSDDVSKQQLGKAQLDMARGMEQHVADTLPANADVSMDQLKQARTALAQNHAVQAALRGKDIDMQAIARIQRQDPDLLSGPLKQIADFANASPEVSSLPSAATRYAPPSLAKDAAGFDIMHPVGSAARVLGGGPLARRVLTGDTAKAVEATRQQFPTGGLADQLAPLPFKMQQPPGTAFEPHQPQLATGTGQQDLFGTGANGFTLGSGPAPAAGGHPGDISLADLLSHGVEHGPPEGLSLAPDHVPDASGVPFKRNADFGAGGLSLAEELGAGGPHPDETSGLAQVLSQGVPEGVMARTGKRRIAADTVDFPGGGDRRRLVDLLEGR